MLRNHLLLVALVLSILPPGRCMPQAAGEPKPPPQEAKPADQPAAAAAPAAPRENRLAKEASLYLRQHGKNPVDWYPWGEEALAKAKKENKLIFLSVGYSSCHWCHVMERESFEDKEIAAYLNKHFVCIKVDREERPEIDAIYMASLQVYMQAAGLGRGGGWPLSMFLTPDGLPFFGHTYLPPRDGDREGLTGFLTIITKLQGVWEKEPKNILTDAETLTKLVKQGLEQRPLLALTPVDAETIDNIQLALFEAFDAKYGGFGVNEEGPSPKFPESPNLVYLVARASHEKLDPKLRAQANQMLQKTLDAIAAGGIYDHLGGGFHRYTVDRAWQIPHFEKMLYDNAQLASVFATAYERFQREQDKLVVRGTLEFVLRELKAPAGGFYSAIDAESEHEEGKFYRWTKEELTTLLSAEERALAGPIYSFDGKPNFEKEFYALQLSAPLAQLAAERKVTVAELDAKLAPIRTKLFDARSQRIRPATDDKILTGMNGQMIRGLADGGRILKEPKYIEAAAQAAEFVWTRLRDDKGRLKRSFAGGAARLNAYLEDYAYFADGLLALHEATGDERWLKRADEVTAKQIELFWDARFGGFFYTSSDHEALLARVKEFSDNAQPAGNSVAVANLLTLSEKLSHKEYRAKAAKTIQCAGGMMQRSPLYAPQLGAAAARWLETETP